MYICTIVLFRSVPRLLVTTNVVPSSPVLVTPMLETLRSPETSVLTRARQLNFPENGILRSCRRENLKSYTIYVSIQIFVPLQAIFLNILFIIVWLLIEIVFSHVILAKIVIVTTRRRIQDYNLYKVMQLVLKGHNICGCMIININNWFIQQNIINLSLSQYTESSVGWEVGKSSLHFL
jgi:hypothetical protein